MIKNPRNEKVAKDVINIDKKYLKHIEDNKLFPYVDNVTGLDGGAKIESDSDVEEVIERSKATGLEPLEYYTELVGNGKTKKSLSSKLSKEILRGKPKDIKIIVKHLEGLTCADKKMGGSLGDFFSDLIKKITGVASSAKTLGKTVYKTFADPQNIDKHDIANMLTLGTAEGMNPEYKEKVKKERARAKKTKELLNPRDKKGYGKEKKEGAGIFDIVGDLLGLGKSEGMAEYKKDSDKKEKKSKKGGAKITADEMVPKVMQLGTVMGGKKKKRELSEWQKLVQKVSKQPDMKGKKLKEVIAYIKENDLYKKK